MTTMLKAGLGAGMILMAVPAAAQMAHGAHDAAATAPTRAAMPGITKAAAYVAAAGAGDLYEKTSSQIVLKDAKNPKVRQFAQMMVSDHTKTTMQVTTAAQASGMTPMPPELTPDQARMIADLRAAPASDRETVYLDQQVTAHTEALALHRGYATHGDVPALKKVAAAAVPIVEHHRAEVKRLAAM